MQGDFISSVLCNIQEADADIHYTSHYATAFLEKLSSI
jgi:hypothetical protein